MARKRICKYFVCDTESTTPITEKLKDGNFFVHHLDKVRVWGVGLCEIGSDDVSFYTSINDFLSFLDSINYDAVIYFHNLKWDAGFFWDFWARHGWNFQDMEDVKFGDVPSDKTIFSLISSLGAVYNVSFITKKKRRVEFRDSLKILPFTVEAIGKKFGGLEKLKGSIDYSKPRPHGYVMDDTEREYLKHDVLIIAHALYKFFDKYPESRNALTIGSLALRDFKHNYSGSAYNQHKTFRRAFPIIENDAYFRDAYRGGWCFVNPKFQGEALHNVKGHVYDVNSLYPSVMLWDGFPKGQPIKWNKPLDELLKTDHPYFIKFEASFKAKPRKFPFLQDKMTIFRESSHIWESECSTWTLSRPDFELFREMYDVSYMNIFSIYYFEQSCSPFRKYVEKWARVKTDAAKAGDEVMRTVAKLMLNSLYGKFAQSAHKPSKNIIADYDGYHFEQYDGEGNPGYIPIGAYITAYARGVTVRAACENYDIFCYSDTDSIHLLGEAKGLEIDPVRIGTWDNESNFTDAKFLRQKTYIEKEPGGDYSIRCAGMPPNVKQNFLDGTDTPIEDFRRGLQVFGKLMRKKVRGGTYLYPSTFKIQ